MMEVCKICEESLVTTCTRNSVCLTLKGCNTINAAGVERGQDIHCIPGDFVHTDCRKYLTDKRRILVAKRKVANYIPEAPKLRSHSSFDFKDHCLFCGFPAKLNGKKRGNYVYSVKTFEFQNVAGRPVELMQQNAFTKITDFLEANINDDEQITIVDLVKKWKNFVNFRIV